MLDPELNERVTVEIEKLLITVAAEEGLCDYRIEKTGTGVKGDGYMGIITSMSIRGTTKSNESKVAHVVVKSASRSDALRKEAEIAVIFDREIYMYDVVVPEFRNFCLEKGLSSFSNFAKCYKTCVMEKSEALILENLKEAGYRLWERRVPMDHEHVCFVMSEYGRLHALSFALRDQQPDRFRKLTVDMYDIFVKFMNTKTFSTMLGNQCKKTYGALDPIADKHALEVFQNFIEEEHETYLKTLDKLVDQHSVILHGDSWTNNMMFQYENPDEPRKPTKVCFFDLQVCRVGPTILDLSYFFYACANKKSIDDYKYYLDIYHGSLSDYLRKLGSDPEKLYPYSLFRQQWKEIAKFGLITSTLIIHAMLSESTEVVDFTEIAESGKSVTEAFDYSISNVNEYNDRVRHIILHFVNNKLI